jgi:hypothetical protein
MDSVSLTLYKKLVINWYLHEMKGWFISLAHQIGETDIVYSAFFSVAAECLWCSACWIIVPVYSGFKVIITLKK